MPKATPRTPSVRKVTAASPIRFTATLQRPGGGDKGAAWTFLNLPKAASAKLPSRGMTSIEGTINGAPLHAAAEPDGQGGHWLRVDAKLRKAAGANAGDTVSLEIAPSDVDPEPDVPADFAKALAAAGAKARDTWADVTPAARRDWISWMTSGKKAETRPKRIATACDMLSKGKRRPCCFDKSGMYTDTLSCPVADDEPVARS